MVESPFLPMRKISFDMKPFPICSPGRLCNIWEVRLCIRNISAVFVCCVRLCPCTGNWPKREVHFHGEQIRLWPTNLTRKQHKSVRKTIVLYFCLHKQLVNNSLFVVSHGGYFNRRNGFISKKPQRGKSTHPKKFPKSYLFIRVLSVI